MGGTPILAFEEPSISQIGGKPMPTTAKHVCKCVTRLLLGPVRPFQRVGRVGIECAKVWLNLSSNIQKRSIGGFICDSYSKAPSCATLAHHSSWWFFAIPKIWINIPRSQDILNISDGQHEFSARDSASRHLNPARRLKGSVGWDGDGWQRVAFWNGFLENIFHTTKDTLVI